MSDPALLPCPLCHRPASSLPAASGVDAVVWCGARYLNPRCAQPSVRRPTLEAAAAEWNRRYEVDSAEDGR